MTPIEIREANLKILEGYPDPIKRRACRALIEAWEALNAVYVHTNDYAYIEAADSVVYLAEGPLPPDLYELFYATIHPEDEDEEEED